MNDVLSTYQYSFVLVLFHFTSHFSQFKSSFYSSSAFYFIAVVQPVVLLEKQDETIRILNSAN